MGVTCARHVRTDIRLRSVARQPENVLDLITRGEFSDRALLSIMGTSRQVILLMQFARICQHSGSSSTTRWSLTL